MSNESSPNDTSAPDRPASGEMADLQIIGGGLAGLIAANLAVDAGLSVRLIEKQRSLGGRAGSSEHDGYTLNQGPHALYLSGRLRSTLGRLGIDPRGTAPRLKGALGTVGGRTDVLPQGPVSLLRTTLLTRGAKRQLAYLMARLPRLDTEALSSVTVDRWVRQVTDRPDLRALLYGLVNLATYSSASDLASAGAALTQVRMATGKGVIYVAGGWATIVRALEQRLQQATGTGRFEHVNAGVTALDTGSNDRRHPEIQTAATATGTYRAANTLLAVGAPALVDRLLGHTNLVEAAGPPVQASVLDLGLRSEPLVSTHLGLDRGLYYSAHSVTGGLAPAGAGLVSLARYLRPGDAHSADENKAVLLAHAAASGIGPQEIVMDRYLHRLTVAWGMPLAERGGLSGRPGPAVPGRPGVYIAGDWVGDVGMLADAGAASASEAVAAVLADTDRRSRRPGGRIGTRLNSRALGTVS